jgi:hypothetical protein
MRKIRLSLALSAEEIAFDLHRQHASAPTVFQRLGRIPEAFFPAGKFE